MNNADNSSPPLRTIRSFVRRAGRMTVAQKIALDELWGEYGVEVDCVHFDFSALFGRVAPVVCEIGFGNGDALLEMASADLGRNYFGIEVHRPGVGRVLARVKERGLTNVRVACADAVDILSHHVADCALAQINVYFPDPWHKKRHNKRRLVQETFAALCVRKLSVGGVLHMATDWQDYAEQMLAVATANSSLRNMAGESQYSVRPPYRPLTKFEQRGHRLGHGIWDMLFERIA